MQNTQQNPKNKSGEKNMNPQKIRLEAKIEAYRELITTLTQHINTLRDQTDTLINEWINMTDEQP